MPRKDIPNPFSSKLQKQEQIKCGLDPLYFIKRYCKITHPDRGLLPFETYPFQEQCIKDFEDYIYNIVVKSRQLGLSTVISAYCLWMALFQADKNVLIIATDLAVSKELFRKIMVAYDNLPEWVVLPKETGRSQKHIEFSNRSRITAIPTGDNAGRSQGVSLLVVDEAAHIHNFEELWTGLKPTVSTGGKIILLSSPKGVGSLFHKLWQGSDQEEKSNNFHGINLPWTVHPEHDQKWFENETRDMDTRGIEQEYLCSFLGSGQTYLGEDILRPLRLGVRDPIAKDGHDLATWIWKFPVEGHDYLITADVARGDSTDFSAAHVIDITDDEVVAEFKGKLPPDRFGERLEDLGYKYRTAMICIELNSFGFATSSRLKDLKYPKLYYEKFAKYGVHSSPRQDEVEELLPGLTTTTKTRPQMLTRLEEVLRNQKIRVYSSRLLEEAKTFVWKQNALGGKAEAMKGYNDDLIMSLAMAAYLHQATGTTQSDDEMTKAMLAAWSKNSTVITQPGIMNPMNPAASSDSSVAFAKVTSGTQQEWFQKPITARNLPIGVDPRRVRQLGQIYNAYSWLLGK